MAVQDQLVLEQDEDIDAVILVADALLRAQRRRQTVKIVLLHNCSGVLTATPNKTLEQHADPDLPPEDVSEGDRLRLIDACGLADAFKMNIQVFCSIDPEKSFTVTPGMTAYQAILTYDDLQQGITPPPS